MTASASLETCLEEVPEDTREWKPDRAPQATETKSTGNIMPLLVEKPVKAGAVMVALPWKPRTKMPRTAQTIMVTIMMVVR